MGEGGERGVSMPALNWDVFIKLPGNVEKNFEQLCRGIVRLNFGSYGVFRALANQPGVEFHLKLDQRCDALGNPNRWWGWQCKWYDLPANGALGTTRRIDVQDGIRKAEAHVAGLTDWVLWTRRTLTKQDQQWFHGLSSRMTLHLWTADEIDIYLAGQAAVLRSTYFGELVLTPDILREQHEQAVAPIRVRWQPDVHHVSDAERDLRRMLGESESWDVLRVLSMDLREHSQAVEAAPQVPEPFAPLLTRVATTSRQFADALDRVAGGIRSGDLDRLHDELILQQCVLPHDLATAPRRLRCRNYRAGLYATNAVAGCHQTERLLEDVETAFSSRVVAVLAPAGCGKTHLAAQLTAGTSVRPHGVLLHGRNMHANHTLDDLARQVLIAAQPVPSMESLLAAVDSAGQRAHHRLPVVIDGLNESEDPRAWKPLLASFEATLARYPYVLLVCTLRPEFVVDALPDGTRRVEINSYGAEAVEAIREHFRYWKIDPTDASLPEFLKHPLTLRLFCEVTNPTRQKVVGVGAMPGSLTALFDRYLEQVGNRISELAPRTYRYFAQDVRTALTTIANKLWDSRARSIDFDELKQVLGDAQRPWDQCLVRALEHEGVLLRMPSNRKGEYVPVYDMLGGHIIANALLAKHGQLGFEMWIRGSSTTTLLAGDYNIRHPLADDVVLSLVGQLPRRFHSKQLWQLVDEPLRERALRSAAGLEPAFLDAATVDALCELVYNGDVELLARLWEIRGTAGHPLNADTLDSVLRRLAVSDRDLRWTEWIRKNQDEVLRDLENLERRWRLRKPRAGDQLRARWVMWTLTSTVRRVRDQATRALYWFGRVDPGGLFQLTIGALTVNDSYVGERMLAASYGVVMSHQNRDAEFGAHLKPFLEQLTAALVGKTASAPTFHYLARLYVRGIVTFSAKFYTSVQPNALSGIWAFASPAPVQPLAKGDEGADEAGRTLHMDFENYTLGRLFDDRRNYDMDHVGHQAAVAHVRGVVWKLGWRRSSFETLDRRIAEDAYGNRGRGNRPLAERYGKKYCLIGFFIYAGVLDDQGLFPRENRPFSDVDIDPSFPDKPPTDGDASVSNTWLSPTVKSHERWIREGTTSLPQNLLRREKIGDHLGPWVAVHGFVKAEDRVLGRKACVFMSALVTDKLNAPQLASALRSGTQPRGALDVPSDHSIFAGEIPWHPNFAFVALAENAYRDEVRINSGVVEIEVLAHSYAWESYHSEMNLSGNALVPSQPFSTQCNLCSGPQSFDQFLSDGSRATITLSGVDGLNGDILYAREDLLRRYVGERVIVWFAFGRRDLLPYPPSPPQWLADAQRQQTNVWCEVLTEEDLKQKAKSPRTMKVCKRHSATTSTAKKPSAKRVPKQVSSKNAKRTQRKP